LSKQLDGVAWLVLVGRCWMGAAAPQQPRGVTILDRRCGALPSTRFLSLSPFFFSVSCSFEVRSARLARILS